MATYRDRMQRVLDHIDAHPDGDLSVAALAAVAAFSPYHFHRQFSAAFGLPVYRYVQLVRLKRASHRLAFDDMANITDVALDAGYDAPDAFSRAFRERLGQLPSAFRDAPDWVSWVAAIEPLSAAWSKLMSTFSPDDVVVREVPPIAVALMEHRGSPAQIYETVRRFIAWRRTAGLGRDVSATHTVFHSDPNITPAADFRVDLCAATDRAVPDNDAGVIAGLIPAGRCAVLRVVGGSENLEAPALFLYRDWLPSSGEEPRDFPLYCHRVAMYPDVPERETVTDLYLPLH